MLKGAAKRNIRLSITHYSTPTGHMDHKRSVSRDIQKRRKAEVEERKTYFHLNTLNALKNN